MTEHATRWSELARLPYFHMVRMIVIDPMHNLLLGKLINPQPPQSLIHHIQGLVKSHFYNIWVQGKILRPSHELRMLHAILAEVRPIVYIEVTSN